MELLTWLIGLVIRLVASIYILAFALTFGVVFILFGYLAWLLSGEGYTAHVTLPEMRL